MSRRRHRDRCNEAMGAFRGMPQGPMYIAVPMPSMAMPPEPMANMDCTCRMRPGRPPMMPMGGMDGMCPRR